LGTPDIENYVPRECFIDFREFKNFRELNDFLENMDAQTYQTYIEHIDKWVGQGGLRPLSMHAIHEQIVEILALEKNILASDLYQGSQNWTPGVAAELTELRWNPVIGKAFWTYEYLSQARSPLIDYQKEHFDLLSSNRQYLKKIDQLRLKNKLLEASREFENLFCNGIFTSDLVYQHAQLLTDLSHFKESQEKLQQVLLMKPNHSLALNDLGGLFMLQKDYAKAVEYFHSALSFDVRNDQALENLLSLLLSLNFKDYIAELIQKLLPLRSGDGDFLAILKKYNLSIDPENRKLSDELNPIPAVGGSPGHGIY
jgi:tetratricopeptide (TPR) repeat protein